MQRINKNTFKNVDKLMQNIVYVLDYLKEEISNIADNKLNFPELIFTKNKKSYYLASDNEYYRIYTFIENTISYFHADDINLLKQSAIAFAKFQLLLKDFPAEILFPTIENFHDTRKRLDKFIAATIENSAKRKDTCGKLINEILKRDNYAKLIMEKLDNKLIPLRVAHNDTKISNILFSKDTKEIKCIVDYDTIMSGSLLFDFGDAIREGCNNASEDEKDLTKVSFNIEKYENYTKNYVNILKNTITKNEIEMLVWAPIVLTYELLIRFLTDYLEGDKYFKIAYEDHNLIRSKCQFKLLCEMEKNIDKMKKIIDDINKN